MARSRQYAFEKKLSPPAREHGKQLLREGKSPGQVVAALAEKFGEQISPQAVQQYSRFALRQIDQEFEEIESSYRKLLHSLEAHPQSDDAKVARAMLFQALLKESGPLKDIPREKLIAEVRQHSAQALAWEKLKAIGRKVRGLEREVGKEKLSPQELQHKLREIYGLAKETN